MAQTTEKKLEEVEWKSISVDEDNKKELYNILRNLEEFHDTRFRINVALKHIITVYNKISNKEKYYNIVQELQTCKNKTKFVN